MKYGVIKNGKYTGVFYDEINEKIIKHHMNQGELIVDLIEEPQPKDYDELGIPIYDSVDFETQKQAKKFMLDTLFKEKIKETDYIIFKAIEQNKKPQEINPDKFNKRVKLRSTYETIKNAIENARNENELSVIEINLPE